jgi:hypothetical protein
LSSVHPVCGAATAAADKPINAGRTWDDFAIDNLNAVSSCRIEALTLRIGKK